MYECLCHDILYLKIILEFEILFRDFSNMQEYALPSDGKLLVLRLLTDILWLLKVNFLLNFIPF